MTPYSMKMGNFIYGLTMPRMFAVTIKVRLKLLLDRFQKIQTKPNYIKLKNIERNKSAKM